jgi:hypothetical protein
MLFAWIFAALIAVVVFIAAVLQLGKKRVPYIEPLTEQNRHAYVALTLLATAGVVVAYMVSGKANINSFELLGLKADLRRVENSVAGLQSEIEAFYKARRSETFDEKNWRDIHFNRSQYYGRKTVAGDRVFEATVVLKEEPVPGSVSIVRGYSVVQDSLITIDGRRIKFLTYSDKFGERYPDPIVVSYFAKLGR